MQKLNRRQRGVALSRVDRAMAEISLQVWVSMPWPNVQPDARHRCDAVAAVRSQVHPDWSLVLTKRRLTRKQVAELKMLRNRCESSCWLPDEMGATRRSRLRPSAAALTRLFNFQWLVRPDGGLRFQLSTYGSRRRLFINWLFVEQMTAVPFEPNSASPICNALGEFPALAAFAPFSIPTM
jgi:hypothetical protein